MSSWVACVGSLDESISAGIKHYQEPLQEFQISSNAFISRGHIQFFSHTIQGKIQERTTPLLYGTPAIFDKKNSHEHTSKRKMKKDITDKRRRYARYASQLQKSDVTTDKSRTAERRKTKMERRNPPGRRVGWNGNGAEWYQVTGVEQCGFESDRWLCSVAYSAEASSAPASLL